jgi:hypothetical protein
MSPGADTTGSHACAGRPSDPRQNDLPEDLGYLVTEAQHAIIAEAERAYRFSVLARTAAGRRAGGYNAIEACARALGVSRQLLQSYAVLAMRWTPGQFRAALGRRGANGRPLSLSHLLLIAPLPRSAGASWIECVLAEGIDVRELRQRLRRSRTSALGVPHELACDPSRQTSRNRTTELLSGCTEARGTRQRAKAHG